MTYNLQVYNANKRNKEHFLTKDEYDSLKNSKCYICKEQNSNGIDRVDNNIGYILDNCKGCCSTCNYMKKDLDLQKFKDHLEKMFNTMKDYTFKNLEQSKWMITNTIDNQINGEIFKHQSKENVKIKLENTFKDKKKELENIKVKKNEEFKCNECNKVKPRNAMTSKSKCKECFNIKQNKDRVITSQKNCKAIGCGILFDSVNNIHYCEQCLLKDTRVCSGCIKELNIDCFAFIKKDSIMRRWKCKKCTHK